MSVIVIVYLGIGLMIGFLGVGSVIGVFMGGNVIVGVLKKNEEAFGSYMLLSVLFSIQGLYGFVGFFIINVFGVLMDDIIMWQGIVVFVVGFVLGLVVLIFVMQQGWICVNGIVGVGVGYDVFGKMMVLVVFFELYVIVVFVVIFLINVGL